MCENGSDVRRHDGGGLPLGGAVRAPRRRRSRRAFAAAVGGLEAEMHLEAVEERHVEKLCLEAEEMPAPVAHRRGSSGERHQLWRELGGSAGHAARPFREKK